MILPLFCATFRTYASKDKQRKLQHILEAHETEAKGKQSLNLLMERYKTFKDTYMKNIMFDPSNNDLSKYF